MDGDIVIPLDVLLKKNREASRGMAEAISNMMNGDRKKRSAWVK
jgi:DNA relaxase NicK